MEPRRPDEVPWLEVTANILAGYFVGMLLFLLAPLIRGGDDALAELPDDQAT